MALAAAVTRENMAAKSAWRGAGAWQKRRHHGGIGALGMASLRIAIAVANQ